MSTLLDGNVFVNILRKNECFFLGKTIPCVVLFLCCNRESELQMVYLRSLNICLNICT